MELEDLMNLVENRNLQTNLFILMICVLLLNLLDSKIVISLSVVLMIIINFPELISAGDTTDTIKQEIKTNKISDDMYYNPKIHDHLIEIKKYKKYNKVSYKQGVIYMRKFFKTIHILENDTIYNYNQYFENSHLYLKQSINHFQSITVSFPERTYINGIKYGDFEKTKKANQLSKHCRELYNECYYILLNLSHKFNQQWEQKPNIFTKEIDMNTDRTEHYDKQIEYNWSLY
jgi:hypothetical protein